MTMPSNQSPVSLQTGIDSEIKKKIHVPHQMINYTILNSYKRITIAITK